MPLGAIDRSTVSWLDLPNHIGSKYFTYNFDTRNIQMTETNLGDAVLTGESICDFFEIVNKGLFVIDFYRFWGYGGVPFERSKGPK